MAGYFDGAKVAVSGNDSYAYMTTAPDLADDSLDVSYGEVLANEEYRPDKIALRIYGDETLDWVIDEANSFDHGVKEYARGVKLRFPAKAELRKMGII